jgi:xanthine dehydrogenase YagS FAD-binding subunit
MHPFSFVEAETAEQALNAIGANAQAAFFAGGTTLIDLMKLDVLQPAELVDINRLPFASIEADAAGITIGANVRNSDLAHDSLIRESFPVLSEALLAGASAQLRNMASTAGNLMQRTRCAYFRDVNSSCNRRQPGSGCDALTGYNRSHAILGTSDLCIATHPSDMCVALVALDAVVQTQQRDGDTRTIPLTEFYLLPGETPERETALRAGELITHVHIPNSAVGRRSHYLKVRDRASYEFALSSAAVALQIERGAITEARIAMGGVATVPWRSREAERTLEKKPAVRETFVAAAEAALANAKPLQHNAFKVQLAKRTLVLALEELLERRNGNGGE